MAAATSLLSPQFAVLAPPDSKPSAHTVSSSQPQLASSFSSVPSCQLAYSSTLESGGARLSANRKANNILYTSFLHGERTSYHSLRAAVVATSSVNGETRSSGGGALGAQMNIFDRVGRIFRAFVESVVSSNEDPEKLLDQAVIEMGSDLARLRQTSAQVLASQRMLEQRYNKALEGSEEWYRRARLAMERGDEPLAREALKRRKAFEDSVKSLKAQLEQQTGVADRILSSSRALESKISEARSKKDQLKARAQSAKTSKQVQEMLGSIDTSSALAAYERMEEKVERLEAEADALTQLTADDLTSQFAALEAEDVGDDLEKLKREIGTGKVRGELPSWDESVRMRERERERERYPSSNNLY